MATNQNIEIELKLPLQNAEEVARFLNAQATPIAQNVRQKDIYYLPPHRDFLQTRYPFEWLRLRQSPQGNFLNYKHYYPENTKETDYCDEFESKLDSPPALQKILAALNFTRIAVVDKTRTTWHFRQAEIALDQVKNLGTFIELEALQAKNSPQATKQHLRDILAEIRAKVGKPDLRGYPYRILEKQGYFQTFGNNLK